MHAHDVRSHSCTSRRAPIAGWALIWSVFLFVRRNWEADQQHITNFLQTFAHQKMQVRNYLDVMTCT